MPVLKLIEECDADERVRKVYDILKERYGGILPPIYQAMANDPEYLESIVEHMGRVMKPRKIDAKTKEIIAYVVGAMNQCDFCINAHALGLRKRFGLDDEAIAEILSTTALWNEVTRFNIGARVTWPKE